MTLLDRVTAVYTLWRAMMRRRVALESLGRINRFWPEVSE